MSASSTKENETDDSFQLKQTAASSLSGAVRLLTRVDLAGVDGVAAASAEGAEQKRLPCCHVHALSGQGALDHELAQEHFHWSIHRYVQDA